VTLLACTAAIVLVWPIHIFMQASRETTWLLLHVYQPLKTFAAPFAARSRAVSTTLPSLDGTARHHCRFYNVLRVSGWHCHGGSTDGAVRLPQMQRGVRLTLPWD